MWGLTCCARSAWLLAQAYAKENGGVGLLWWGGGDSNYSSSIDFNINIPKIQTRLNSRRRNNKNNKTQKHLKINADENYCCLFNTVHKGL